MNRAYEREFKILEIVAPQGFETFGDLRQLSSCEVKQLGDLRKEVSTNSVMLRECETPQNSCNSKIMRFFGLCPQNDKSYSVTNLLTYLDINLFT